MQISRREMMQKMAAAGLVLALPRVAKAELMIGEGKLTTLSDGHLVLPRSFVVGDLPEDEVDPILEEYGASGYTIESPCNITLYQSGDMNVLFDVGSGPDFQASAGRLSESLDAANISPDEITHVVFTHAHPDHIWGLLDEFDEPSFPNASYMMGRAEWDYWWNPETVNTIGEARAAFAVGAKRRMEAIENQVEFVDDNQEILTGILAVSTPGHTPGHMSFEIRQGGDAAMVIGDAIANPHLAFHRPDWPNGSDQDTELGAKTRVALLDRIAADQLQISGFHLPDGGMGRVEPDDDAFIFVAD